MAELHITVQDDDGAKEIVLKVSDDVFRELQQIARKRELTVSAMIAEALRLERLFAISKEKGDGLYLKSGGRMRELAAV